MDFNPREMQVLSAIADTFCPSLAPEAVSEVENEGTFHLAEETKVYHGENFAKVSSDELQAFYSMSASEWGIPAEAAKMMCTRFPPHVLKAVRVLLWMLSTCAGTFMLGGRVAVSAEFPYFHNFVTLSHAQKERMLLSWSQSPSTIFQTFFKVFKMYILVNVYDKVNEKLLWNPSWNAIGYKSPKKPEMVNGFSPKPLEGKVVHVKGMREDEVLSSLASADFQLLENVNHLVCAWEESKSSARRPRDKGMRRVGVCCDVVVVGSGSGGGVIAGFLAKAGYKVLVLEKGTYIAREDLHLEEARALDEMYEGGGVLSTQNGSVSVVAGSTVGGGSAVNWAASLKTPEHVRKEWAEEHGLPMFVSKRYTNALDQVCERLGVQTYTAEDSLQNAALRKGCEVLGYPVEGIPQNACGSHSCGWCCFGCKSGEKQSTSETWLVDAVNHGALILSGCHAQEVICCSKKSSSVKARKALGVVTSLNEKTLLFIQARVTVAACGSLHTPLLLRRSGLENPNIGKHLHLHPVCFIWGYFGAGDGIKGTCYEGGIMTSVSKVAANWETTGYGCLLETPILHPGLFAAVMPWLSATDFKGRMRKFARTAHFIVLTRDKGSGKVGTSGETGVNVKYNLSLFDKGSMIEGVEKGLRILLAAGAEEVGLNHCDGEKFIAQGSSVQDFEAYLQRVRAKGIKGLDVHLSSAHQMGSCRMGKNAACSVVDGNGETWDVSGLYVGDASVFPTASGVNPMITVQSIAYCIAESVCQRMQEDEE